MPKYIPYSYNQHSMVVINYQEQLQPGTFEHAIHFLIENKLDLSIFYPNYKNDEGGRPAYDPAILLKIILFAYSKGITSSREIEWCCDTNIIFKALSCDTVPHFTTIASFISSHADEIENLFEQILLICDEQGLLGHELFAIDGCKMSSDASKEWSGTFKELEQKRTKLKKLIHHHITEHQKLDKCESRDDERIKRTEQTIDTLNNAFDKVDKFLKTAQPRIGKGKQGKEVKSNITDNESAKMTTSKGTIQGYNGIASVDKKHQIIIDAQVFGSGQEQHTLQPILETIKARYRRLGFSQNLYQDNVIVTADTGFANEDNIKYLIKNKINGYIPDNQFRSRDPKFKDHKTKYKTKVSKKVDTFTGLPASEFSFNAKDFTCICPAGEAISYRGQRVDKQNNIKVFFEGRLLQCRHCEIKTHCMKNPDAATHRKGNGRQVSFMIKKQHKENVTDWMRKRIDSDKGKQIYSHRMSVVEPVFGNIGTNKKLNRFSLRSQTKVQSQWRMYCLVHNIEKLKNYGKIAA
ncbi:MAG: transposase [Gammaproteobacteria bacterium]|nr:transposase [Gammaproteobacteria bacterium]